MASLTNMVREWTKPLVPTVFPAASPSIQAYQRQSLNFANGQLSVSLKDRPGLDLGETLWNIQLSPYKETGGSNQSQSWGQDVGQKQRFCFLRIVILQKTLDLKYIKKHFILSIKNPNMFSRINILRNTCFYCAIIAQI